MDLCFLTQSLNEDSMCSKIISSSVKNWETHLDHWQGTLKFLEEAKLLHSGFPCFCSVLRLFQAYFWLSHPMKNFTNIPRAVSVVFLLFLCVWCKGQEETSAAPMEKTEKEALYSTIEGFVGNWWNGSDLYPDPCGWTPIQVLFNHMFRFPSCLE